MSVAVVAGKFKIHFLTEIKIMKLIIDAFSILMMHLVFSSALPKNLRIHFFVEQTVDKPLQNKRVTRNLSGEGSFLGIRAHF